MSWPKFLIEELAERRCVVVVGAGVSRSCETALGERPPSWEELLVKLLDLVQDAGAKAEAERMIRQKAYLSAAQVLADSTVQVDRERVMKALLEREYVPSDWVRLIRDLDQNIIVTTNYDCILEDACPRTGYRTHIHHDKEPVKVLRGPERLIFKVHGCLRRDPSSLVLAMSDYHSMRAEHPHCLKLLESIFTTHTGLFLGFSMNDPDLQLVMQNVAIAFPHAPPHILLSSEDLHSAVRKAMEASMNLSFVAYQGGDHAAGLRLLQSLYDDVMSLRATRTGAI